MQVTGKSKIMFILADPVAHVLGTDMLNRYFENAGQDIVASPLHVPPEHLAATVQAIRAIRNVIGFGVTIPHKIAIMPHLDSLTPRAAHIGAVNFVRRDDSGLLTGDNLDGFGFVQGSATAGVHFEGAAVVQLGAGGAGRAVAFAIAQAGARSLKLHNRSYASAQALAEAVGQAYPNCAVVAVAHSDPTGAEIVVNTTSLGMHQGDETPLDFSLLRPEMSVAEIIMSPARTPLLAHAQALGCRIVPGKNMLLGQMQGVQALLGVTAR